MVAALVAGCPNAVVPPPKAPTPAARAKARWAFSTPLEPLARIALPEGALIAGRHGRRRFGTTEAETLLGHDAVAIQRAPDGRFFFVTTSGRLEITDSPLGPVVGTLPGPAGAESESAPAISDATAGHESIVIVDSSHAAFRSVDFGKTWSALSSFAGKFGPRSVALDREGHGLIMAEPQRLFLTMDDGATWSRIESFGNAPRRVFVGDDGRVRTDGRPGGVLALSPARIVESTAKTRRDPREIADGPVFVGARVARVIGPEEGPWKLRIGELGGEFVEHPLPTGEYWSRSLVGDEHALRVGIVDKQRITLFRSEDAGASWVAEGSFPEPRYPPYPLRRLVLGPEGTLVAIGITLEGHEKEDAILVRAAGAAYLSVLPLPEPFGDPHAVVVEGQTLWLLDNRGNLARSDESPPKLRPVLKNLEGTPRFTELSSDGKGGVWLVHPKGMRHLDAAGHALGSIEFPYPMRVRMAGARGFAVSASFAFETKDGGAHFGRVASSDYLAATDFACRAEGCAFGEGDRIGWDEPAPAPFPPLAEKPATPPGPKPVEIACAAKGPWQELVQRPTWLDGKARWAGIAESKTGMVSLAIGATDGKVQLHPLLQKKPKETLFLEGALAARITPEKTELAWWSLGAEKVLHHTVVGEEVSDPAIVDGGVSWQAGDHLTFLPDGGSLLPLPFGRLSDVRGWVVRAGKHVVSTDSWRFHFWDGTTETDRDWNLSNPMELVNIEHRPFAALELESENPWLVALDQPTIDPGDPIPFPTAKPPLCTDTEGKLFRLKTKTSDQAFSVAYDVLPHLFREVDRLLLVHRDGTACLRGWEHDGLMILANPSGGLTGWTMEKLGNEYAEGPRPVRIRPIACGL